MPIPHQASYGNPDSSPWHTASTDAVRQTSDPSLSTAPLKTNLRTQDATLQLGEQEGPLCTDRAELIERIKKGESPTWVPSERLQEEYLKENGIPALPSMHNERSQSSSAMDVEQTAFTAPDIERPPSALHAGDFKKRFSQESASGIGEGPPRPPAMGENMIPHWLQPSQIQTFDDIAPWTQKLPLAQTADHERLFHRSFSSSNYILKQPTTPLVYQSTRSPSPEKASRRHTLPPSHSGTGIFASPLGSLNACRTPPLSPARQARRSAAFTWSLQHPPSPPTPGFLKSRRASCSLETSARHRASMVGSYEESILQGRMSTAPSKPFDFHAHIGVLGQGKRPKMPPQIQVPFQAVFYDWFGTSQQRISDKEPSPYVGEIDLQKRHILPQTKPTKQENFDSSQASYTSNQYRQQEISDGSRPENISQSHASDSSNRFAVPVGSYRIPIRGQIQVVIKNPYKTALKLFLVPYDLSAMRPGQKTFVRQRYYSAGPVIERPIIANSMTALPANHSQKPMLRYLIHLKMCCPRQGYHCLYSDIRVVFANRVPDDKEYLTKDLQEPNPKYSQWKPSDHSLPSTPTLKEGARAFRRRSSGFNYKDSESLASSCHSNLDFSSRYASSDIPPVPPIPFNLPPSLHPCGGIPGAENTERESEYRERLAMSNRSTVLGDQTVGMAEPVSSSSSHSDDNTYTKLKLGDAGYGGNWSRVGMESVTEGLLARRLKSETEHVDPEMSQSHMSK